MPMLFIVDSVERVESVGTNCMRIAVRSGGEEMHLDLTAKDGCILGLMADQFFAQWLAKRNAAARIKALGGMSGGFVVLPPNLDGEKVDRAAAGWEGER